MLGEHIAHSMHIPNLYIHPISTFLSTAFKKTLPLSGNLIFKLTDKSASQGMWWSALNIRVRPSTTPERDNIGFLIQVSHFEHKHKTRDKNHRRHRNSRELPDFSITTTRIEGGKNRSTTTIFCRIC